MYSPDQADIDPRNPANFPETKFTFIVADYKVGAKGNVSISDMLCKEFVTEESAKDELLSLTRFLGDELDVLRCDEEGDQMVVFCAVWDEEKNRYVEA